MSFLCTDPADCRSSNVLFIQDFRKREATLAISFPELFQQSSVIASSEAIVPASKKSALVLGWFGAQEKELELVKRLYLKKGYSDVVSKHFPPL